MVASMTSFARTAGEGALSQTVWEVRSVNHRFLDISFKLPEALRGLESAARELVSARLARGKVDCILRHDLGATSGKVNINWQVAASIAEAAQKMVHLLPQGTTIDPLDLLRWPGVISSDQADIDELGKTLLQQLDRTLDALVATRLREGHKLCAILQERSEQAQHCVERVRSCLPHILAKARERLHERLKELGSVTDPGRLEQEMVLTAQKLDIAEELDRLDTHLSEVCRLLQEPGPNGRRLDFLMQELNREANTIASKSAHVDTTGAAVDLKVLIEQMREQIQNIE